MVVPEVILLPVLFVLLQAVAALGVELQGVAALFDAALFDGDFCVDACAINWLLKVKIEYSSTTVTIPMIIVLFF